MKIYFRGKYYTTLEGCYRENKDLAVVGIATIRKRIKQGFSLEEAFITEKEIPHISKFGSHIVEDIEYENLPAIAKAYGMSTDAVYKRYSRGCRGDDLVPVKKRKKYSPPVVEPKQLKTEVIINGKKYKSAMQACNALGIKYITLRNRLKRGLTMEEAFGFTALNDKRYGNKSTYSVQGKNFTIAELSQEYNAPIPTIRDRLQRGATLEQAIGLVEIKKGDLITQSQYKELAKKRNKKPKLEVNGKTYKTYKELAEAYSLPVYVVRQRIVDYGYSPEEAVTAEGKTKKVIIAGVKYQSLSKAAEAYGITYEHLLAKMNNGLTIEQALGLEEYDTANTIIFKGKKYRSLAELASERNISVTKIRRRMSSGLSLEDAFQAGDRILNKGRYNETILLRDPELATSDAELYFIKFFYGGKTYYKVGITRKNVDERIKSEGFEYETIVTISNTLFNVWKLEQEILALVKDRRADFSAEVLDGYSEVLDITQEEANIIETLVTDHSFD